jgi:uncharacterized Zn finger protein (UPF0148 family)
MASISSKAKTKIKDSVCQKETIDSLHRKMKSHFDEQPDEINLAQTKINNLTSELAELRQHPDYTRAIPDFKIQHRIWKIEEEIQQQKEFIQTISNKKEEKEYVLKTGKLLNQYYKLLEKEKEIIEKNSQYDFGVRVNSADKPNQDDKQQSSFGNGNNGVSKPKSKDKKNILDWLNSMPSTGSNNSTGAANNNCDSQPKINIVLKSASAKQTDPLAIPDEPKKKSDKLPDKQKIYDKYRQAIDPNYVSFAEDEFELFDICFHCHYEMVLNHNTGMLNCNNCGMTERIIVDSDKQSHKEPPKEMTSFSYKRINHLNEILSQFQAKETTDIPDEVYDKILAELKKERIDNMSHLTRDKLREILKKIDETDYYEHIPYIINQLNGVPPPVISPEVEEIIRGLFLQLQHPFNTNRPDDRKNFLTYGYILYKIFQLLELDEYLCNFKFLKDRKKLYEQEQIWKAICKELRWEFIPSI